MALCRRLPLSCLMQSALSSGLQLAPDRRVVGGSIPAARSAIDVGGEQAVRSLRR